MTFSKHENHEQSIYIAANLILEEGQKQIKIESQKNIQPADFKFNPEEDGKFSQYNDINS